MAEKIDINQLIADAKKKSDEAKAAAVAAAKEAAKKRSEDQYQSAVKAALLQRNTRIDGYQRSLDEMLFNIQRLAKLVGEGLATPGDQKELKRLASQYNSLIDTQSSVVAETKALTNGTGKLDLKTGKVTLGATPATSNTSASTSSKQSNTVPIENRPFGSEKYTGTANGKSSTFDWKDDTLYLSDKQYTGTVTWSDGTVVKYKNGKEESRTAATNTVNNTASAAAGATGNTAGASTGGGKTYKGTGTKQDPLTLNGKPFTGSYNGKKYTNGVIAAAEDTGTGLTAKQEATLGTYGSKYLLEYFKINYPKIYNDLLKFAQANESPTNVEGYLRNTAWYTDVNQRVKATIGGYALANGLTLSSDQETQFRDQILAKVKDREEIQYQIRLLAIDKFQLETTKPDIARAMKAGLDFNQAAADYIQIYRDNFNVALSQFSVNDQLFQTLLTKSSNIADFTKQLRRTDKYLSQPQVQQQLNANKLMITTKYRQYGLSITDEAASNLAKNVFLGDSNNEQIDENLRQQAVAAFPAFRDRILNGESPLAIASPYIQAMVRILEIPEGGLDLEDPTIRRAMQGKAIADAKGNTTSYETVPLWMFEQSLYKDNRWQYTANARNKADTITLQLKDMLGL